MKRPAVLEKEVVAKKLIKEIRTRIYIWEIRRRRRVIAKIAIGKGNVQIKHTRILLGRDIRRRRRSIRRTGSNLLRLRRR